MLWGDWFGVSHPVVNDGDYGKCKTAECRRDRAIFGSQRRDRLLGSRTRRSLPMDRRDLAALSILAAVQGSARSAAGIHHQDDGLERAPGDALDRAILGQWAGAREGVSAASLCASV